MERGLALEFVRVTEAAALNSARWMGKGDKIKADDAAVKAMRAMFDTINVKGTVVIGEGEMDEAPMLYIGEVVGKGEECVDIAVEIVEQYLVEDLGYSNYIFATIVYIIVYGISFVH